MLQSAEDASWLENLYEKVLTHFSMNCSSFCYTWNTFKELLEKIIKLSYSVCKELIGRTVTPTTTDNSIFTSVNMMTM